MGSAAQEGKKKEKKKSHTREAFEPWKTDTTQDGKPYILSMTAGPAEANERSQGYTFVAKSEFASVEDMKFYDDECEVHMELKKTVMSLQLDGKPLMVYLKPKIVVGA